MLLKSHTGLGQDPELLRMRRRPFYLTLLIVAAVVAGFIVAVFFLRQRSGSLLVTTDQFGAVVILNGSPAPTPTGELIKGLPPDTYSVSVAKEGYECLPPTALIRLKAGKTATAHFTLTLRPREEPLIPTSHPAPNPKPSIPTTLILEKKPDAHSRKPAPDFTLKQREAPPERLTSTLVVTDSNSLTAGNERRLTGRLQISTQPEKGSVYVDDVFRGAGQVELTDLPLGEVVVHFGELSGYRAPAPQKVFLSQDRPTAQIEGIYLPLIYIAAFLNESGKVVLQKSSLTIGYLLNEAQPHADPVIGPEVKYLAETGAFAWEMGYAFSNRNPAGVDFLEMKFTLPEHWDGLKPLELRLYGFASEKRFPFAAGTRCSYDVFVNGKPVRLDLQAQILLGQAKSGAFETVAVNTFLHLGENTLRIQTSSASRCYYYLQKIVLL